MYVVWNINIINSISHWRIFNMVKKLKITCKKFKAGALCFRFSKPIETKEECEQFIKFMERIYD